MNPFVNDIMNFIKNGGKLKLLPEGRVEALAATALLLRDLDADPAAVKALEDSVKAELKALAGDGEAPDLSDFMESLRIQAGFPRGHIQG